MKQSHLLNLLNYALLYGDNLSSYLEMKLPVLLVKTQSFCILSGNWCTDVHIQGWPKGVTPG